MKRNILSLLAVIFTISLGTSQSTVEGLLRKYKNDDQVMTLMYEGDQLDKYIKKSEGIKSSVEFIDVLVFKDNTGISAKDKVKLKEVLEKQAYETLIDIKNKEAKARVLGIGDIDKLTNVFVEVNAEDVYIYAVLKGNVLLNEISKIASSIDLKELSSLKILD